MNIRYANIDDAKMIANLHTVSWQNTYSNVLKEDYLQNTVPTERNQIWKDRLTYPTDNQHVFVAEFEGAIIGFVCLFIGDHPDWGSYLENLHVSEAYHSKGIGKSLLLQAAECSHQFACNKGMCLLVNQDNLNAQNFYLHLGAHNKQESTWNAPDGSIVPTFWFIWESLENLVEKSKNLTQKEALLKQ